MPTVLPEKVKVVMFLVALILATTSLASLALFSFKPWPSKLSSEEDGEATGVAAGMPDASFPILLCASSNTFLNSSFVSASLNLTANFSGKPLASSSL